MRRLPVVGILAAAILVAGCFDADPMGDPGQESTPDADSLRERPHVVVAIIDSGINPYHSEFAAAPFADGDALPDPLLPGFPYEEVRLVDVALERELTYDELVEEDRDLWRDIDRGEFVSIPGTKIVGAISFSQAGTATRAPDQRILDAFGHGTMTASRAAGNTVSIGGPEIHLVVVQVSLTVDELASAVEAVEWVAAQDWIDVVSSSWGLPAPTGPASEPYTGWTDAIRDLAAKKPTFFSAGNGLGNGVGTGYPSQLQDTLPEGVVIVGGEDNGRIVHWPNHMPHVVSDVIGNPAAHPYDRERVSNTGSGTSSAAPFVAGGAAKLLLEARTLLDHRAGVLPGGILATAGPGATPPPDGPLADGDFTLAELRTLLFHTAHPPTESDSDGQSSLTSLPAPAQDAEPAAFYYAFGYGEVDGASIDAALAVLRAEATAPERALEDSLFALDAELRRALYG